MKRHFTARRLTCRCGVSSAANSRSRPTRWTSPCRNDLAWFTRTATIPRRRRCASIAPPRHAPTLHRLPQRVPQVRDRHLPALARARTSARPHHRRRRTVGELRQVHRERTPRQFSIWISLRAETDSSNNRGYAQCAQISNLGGAFIFPCETRLQSNAGCLYSYGDESRLESGQRIAELIARYRSKLVAL